MHMRKFLPFSILYKFVDIILPPTQKNKLVAIKLCEAKV